MKARGAALNCAALFCLKNFQKVNDIKTRVNYIFRGVFLKLTPSLSYNILKKYKKDGLPCLSDTINRLIALDEKKEYSVEDLSSIILEDIGLTGRVLKTVNSFFYRRTGKEVTTVTQAIVLLGFNTIRDIALNMAVLDLAERNNNKLLSRLLFSSFLAAHLVQYVFEPQDGLEREAVFVATLFYPLARIILALFDNDLCKGLFETTEKCQLVDSKASQFLKELGRGISELWGLPPLIQENLEGLGNSSSRLFAAIKDSHEISRIVSFKRDTRDIAGILQGLSDVSGKDVKAILSLVGKATRKTLEFSPRFKGLFSARSLNETIKIMSNDAGHSAESKTVSLQKDDSEDSYINLMAQLTGSITRQGLSLDQIYLFATEVILRGLPVDRVFLLLLSLNKNELVPRYAIGKGTKGLREKLAISFPLRESTLRAGFMENAARISTWKDCLRDEDRGILKKEFVGNGTNQVLMAPIIVSGKSIGCFLMDRFLENEGFSKRDMLKAEAIKDLVVMASSRR